MTCSSLREILYCLLPLLSIGVPTFLFQPEVRSSGVPEEIGTRFSGEFLVYGVYWAGIRVGKIKVQDFGRILLRNRPCQKVEVDARTDGAVERIYKARRKYIGYLTPDRDSWIFEEWEKEKGMWRLKEWLGFFPKKRIVKRYKHGKVRNVLNVPKGTFGPAGAVVRLRRFPLRPGDYYEMTVVESKDLYRAAADVSPGPKLETILGEVRTVLVRPRVYWKGKPLGNREVKVWFTDDDRKVPVRLVADIEFGSFVAVLEEYTPPRNVLDTAGPG